MILSNEQMKVPHTDPDMNSDYQDDTDKIEKTLAKLRDL